MPVERIPIVHKFGIISHSHRLEIQERILTEAQEIKNRNATVKSTRPSYLLGEVSEEFVQKFNSESDTSRKKKYEEQAHHIIARIKRRVGESNATKKSDSMSQVAKGWIDLSLLSQCSGRIQEESLILLLGSLDHTEIHSTTLGSLIYLAEATMYWLRYNVIREPYLRSAEIKLLKVGEMVFDRLFIHHILGDLIGKEDFATRLADYNEGFLEECEQSYMSYPTIVQALSKMSAVANIVSSRNDAMPRTFNSTESVSETGEFHSIAPTIWHSLDIWRCCTREDLKRELPAAVSGLLRCSEVSNADFRGEELMFGLQFLAESAMRDLAVLRTFQRFGKTQRRNEKIPPHQRLPSGATESPDIDYSESSMSGSRRVLSERRPSSPLGNALAALDDEMDSMNLESTDRRSELSDLIRDPEQPVCSPNETQSQSADAGATESPATSSKMRGLVHSGDEVARAASKTLVTEEDIAWDNIALVDKHMWHRGSSNNSNDLGFSPRSASSTNRSYESAADRSVVSEATDFTPLCEWPSEVAVCYTRLMADIVSRASCAQIRKAALLGVDNKDVLFDPRQYTFKDISSNVGLIDLLHYKNESCSWSWMVRFTALESVTRLYKALEHDKSQDGIKNICWAALTNVVNKDKDTRVAEARKIGAVQIMPTSAQNDPSDNDSFGRRALDALLGQLDRMERAREAQNEQRNSPKSSRRDAKKASAIKDLQPKRDPVRPSLRQEVVVHQLLSEKPVPQQTRQKLDLNRIVEDQWRKSLHESEQATSVHSTPAPTDRDS